MDKIEVLIVCNKLLNNILSEQDITKVLTNYCIEMNKGTGQTRQFVESCLFLGLYGDYFKYALDYYKRKYELIEIIKDNKTILIY